MQKLRIKGKFESLSQFNKVLQTVSMGYSIYIFHYFFDDKTLIGEFDIEIDKDNKDNLLAFVLNNNLTTQELVKC